MSPAEETTRFMLISVYHGTLFSVAQLLMKFI